MRSADINRKTGETDISLKLNLDGGGAFGGDTGVGFLNHMLQLFARHGRFDLDVTCRGDIDVDFHHTVEDVGIALGRAFDAALGQRLGIARYGSFMLPMDETLVLVALDISGRAGVHWQAYIPAQKVGDFDTELAREFMEALARQMGLTLHIRLMCGTNSHHIIEAMFKGLARALRQAVAIERGYENEPPSTKGVI